MIKYKIIALFGKAGAGKDFILKQVMKSEYGREYLNKVVPWTTRPQREGERDLVDYCFVPATAFTHEIFNNKFIEYTNFKGWYYGTHEFNLDENKINIGVFNPKGIQNLLERDDILVKPIYIHTNGKIRLLRQLNREDKPDCLEICRRFQADEKDFLNLPFSYQVIQNNYDEIQPIVIDILDIARKM